MDTKKEVLIGLVVVVVVSLVQAMSNDPLLPDTACMNSSDCISGHSVWLYPYPECRNFTCQCPNGTCAVYTTGVNSYFYYCGNCGVLGSECHNTSDCYNHRVCKGNFCDCDKGTVYHELCVYMQPVPTSVSSVALIIVLAILLILQKLISSHKTIERLCYERCRRDSEEEEETSVVGYNPDSDNKTAAFTITNSDFMATSDDPEMAWAIELSRELAMLEDRPEGSESTPSSNGSSRLPLDPQLTHTQSHNASRCHSHSLSSQPGTSGWRPGHSRNGPCTSTVTLHHRGCSGRGSRSSSTSSSVSSRQSSFRTYSHFNYFSSVPYSVEEMPTVTSSSSTSSSVSSECAPRRTSSSPSSSISVTESSE